MGLMGLWTFFGQGIYNKYFIDDERLNKDPWNRSHMKKMTTAFSLNLAPSLQYACTNSFIFREYRDIMPGTESACPN